MIEADPFNPPVDETYLTEEILIKENGCNRIENSDISSDCGDEDQLKWGIDGGSIIDQKLILIKYVDASKQIVVIG